MTTMEHIRRHDDSILQVKIPLPFPLKWVNSYVIGGSGGITVIDPGLHTPEAEQLWTATLDFLGCRFTDIEQIVLTHHHPDHYGIAGWMQRKAGAPVRISRTGYEMAERFWGKRQEMAEELHRLFSLHGMDDATVRQLSGHMDSFIPLVTPKPEVEFLHEGGFLRMGERNYLMIAVSGHAEGHLCFYDRERKVMFCGDHVLPQISPNVSYLPGTDANPLQTFMHDLEKIGGFETAKAYPGHREPFETLAQRAREIIEHHHQRLQVMEEQLQMSKSAYAVCRAVFGERLSIHQLRFAMLETLAHLVYLVFAGRAEQIEEEGILLFSSKGGNRIIP